MKSFSKEIREELLGLEDRKKLCCSISFVYGYFLLSYKDEGEFLTSFTNAENVLLLENSFKFISNKIKVKYRFEKRKVLIESGFLRYFAFAEIQENILKCNKCKDYFLRGIFLSHGYITDPAKSYRLDYVFDTEARAKEAQICLASFQLDTKIAKRNNKYIAYTKSSETISDTLAIIGAQSSAFKVMNEKIMKELRNDVNRASNCDAGNINKTVKANEKYVDAINYLMTTGEFANLPEALKEMALKKSEFDNLTLADLGRKFSPPISKSGVYHRLEKILDYYKDKIKNDEKGENNV